MKTKNEYEKLTYDFWNLSELKELFERGELYYNARDYFFKFETLADLGMAAGINDVIYYKRTDEKLILEEELLEIEQVSKGHTVEFFLSGDTVEVFDNFYHAVDLTHETIHKLSETLKRHGKYKQKSYLINGKKFKADAPVNWDDAIAHGGFYFKRAKHFKLPLPPACFVVNSDNDDISALTDEELEIISAYHTMFDDAEIDAAMKYAEENY